MNESLRLQIAELTHKHKGLASVTEGTDSVVVSGSLSFEASAEEMETITDAFEIEITIPSVYPDSLPSVRETAGKIDADYTHRLSDGALCLAVPVEKRRIFHEHPTLLGFADRLIVPYLYGYCYWKRHGCHPFGEAAHGFAGILQHYVDSLKLRDEAAALSVICYLVEHGYRGHHYCPCGSKMKVRACHGPALLSLHKSHNPQTLRADFNTITILCTEMLAKGPSIFPLPLLQQVLRLMKNLQNESGK